MRRCHLLRHNRGSRLPVLVMAFDTETDSVPIADDAVEARLNFGWLAVTRRHRGMRWTPVQWRRFTQPSEFWQLVHSFINDEWRGYLFAHNLGFDFRVVDGFNELPKLGYELKGAVVDDPPTILRWHGGRKGLHCLDTLNYYRMPLADIGKTFGLAKLEHDYKWGDTDRDNAYCKRDVEIVLRAMQGIIQRTADLDLGNFAATFPSLAFGAYRHRHMRTPILIDDNDKGLILARQGYYGGRTEAFRMGTIDGPVDVYDVVSMYPSVMATEPMPTVLRGVYSSMTVTDLSVATTDTGAVAEVTLDTNEAVYPLVRDGRLIFPIGRFRTILPRPELRHALLHDRVVNVHRVALYDQAVIFATYIAEWWERRLTALQAGDASEADFCKRMMNSLYGKFGQTGTVYETLGESETNEVRSWTEIDLVTGEVYKMRSLAGLTQRQSGESESRDSHPAIAATVTSAARLRLWELMTASPLSFVMYVDTDSIFRLQTAEPSLLSSHLGTTLGALKHERTIRSLTIYGLKDYEMDGVRKTKGLRKNAELQLDGSWRQDQFVGLRGAIQSGDLSRQIIKRVPKRLSGEYTKGTVMPDGRIVPYRLV